MVISLADQGIHNFRSISQLLKALHDVIKVHRSLLMDGKILHRDISENNIIITDPEEAGDFVSMLIDLDLAKELSSGPSSAQHYMGTMQFMAIKVLLGISYTY